MKYMHIIVDLFWENGFLRANLHAMRSPFRAKHINDSMFIEYLVRWRQYCHNIK